MLSKAKRYPRKVHVALLAATAMAVAACGGGGGTNDSASSDGELAQYPGELAGETPQFGGEVVYGLEAATGDGWCLPESQLAISGIQVARSVYDTLTVPDGEGGFRPHLAESVEPNDDYTEWTITLREGIQFHDGSELNAEVVKNNLDAYRGQYEGRSALLLAFVLEDIAEVTAPDDMTVVVKTARPWAAFDSYLYTSGRLGIMAQAQLDDEENCASNLIGTGPFQFDSWDRASDVIELSRNDNYWREDAEGNQLPYLDSLTFEPIPEGQQRTNALLAGNIDAFHMSSNTEAQQFWELADEADAGQINFVHSEDSAEVGYMMLNTTQPPFDNPTARQAMAHAIDRETINEELSNGLTTPASGPFAPGSVGYLEDAGYPEYDQEKAAQLVQQYEDETGNPLEVRITATPQTSLQQLVERTSDYLEDAGISVSTNSFEQTELIQNAINLDYQAMTFRNYPDLDPDNMYVWLYGGSPVNFMGFDNQKINDLLDQGRTTIDPEERTRIYEDLNRALAEELPMLWATYTIWGVPTTSDVYGIVGARPADVPDGSADYTGLATGHDPALLWRAQD